MRIIYMHHAERDINSNLESKQLQDITENGIEESKMVSNILKDQNIKAIITSPYKRCMHTAEIINRYHNVPIVEDERFNEMQHGETWEELLNRNMKAIDDIVNKYSDDDTIICVTSGVNISAFICYFYGLAPSNDIPWSQAINISPVSFTIGKQIII